MKDEQQAVWWTKNRLQQPIQLHRYRSEASHVGDLENERNSLEFDAI